MPSGLENEVKILQMAQVAKRLNLQEEGLSLDATREALKHLAESASARMTAYMPQIDQPHIFNKFRGTLVFSIWRGCCKRRKGLDTSLTSLAKSYGCHG